MLRTAAAAAFLAGCSYQPGSFAHGVGYGRTFVGQRATIGCLDVAVARRADYEHHAVLAYRFGNRCNQPVRVDLAGLAVIGRLADGREVALAPHDPALELRPLRLDGRIAGGEAIAYPAPEPVVQICVDAASIVRGQPARWMCFASADGGEPIAAVAP